MCRLNLLLVLFLLAFCVLKSNAVEDGDLVLYLPFDEGGGTEVGDLSDYGNDGVINGDVQWVDGKFGKGLEFSGDITQYVEIPDAESMRFGEDPFTYMAWVKTYELNRADTQTIMSKRVPVAGDGMETASLFIAKGQESLAVEFRDSIQTMFYFEATDAVLTENEWHHVAWVKDDTELRFYVDGNLMQTEEHDRVGTVNGTQPMVIGVHHYGATWNAPFVGLIDSVAVFRANLNKDDIRARMKNAFPVERIGKLASTWGEIRR